MRLASNLLLRTASPVRTLACRRLPAVAARCMASASAAPGSRQRRLLVAHILLKDKSQTALLDDFERQVTSGSATFAELAAQHSQCGSAKREGQLGWLSRGTYFAEFEEAAFAAPIGGFAKASTPMGIHLIQVQDMREEAVVQQLSVQELSEVLSNPALAEDVQFVDVREDWEYQTAHLPHFKLFPLSKFAEWKDTIASDLDPAKETLVLCHHGVRSMQMATFLVSECGFTDVKNVTSGIHEYSMRVDSSVPVY